jgi:hypothetical protein
MSFNWISWPAWQTISLLPADEKLKLTEQFLEYADTVPGNWHPSLGNPFKIAVDRMNDQAHSTLEELKTQTILLAAERDLDIHSMVPSISHLLKESP